MLTWRLWEGSWKINFLVEGPLGAMATWERGVPLENHKGHTLHKKTPESEPRGKYMAVRQAMP